MTTDRRWWDRAACLGTPAELWWPTVGGPNNNIRNAKAICARCFVRAEKPASPCAGCVRLHGTIGASTKAVDRARLHPPRSRPEPHGGTDMTDATHHPRTPAVFRYEVDERGCWVWLGRYDRNGYGRVWDPTISTQIWAHRFSYELHNGPIPDGREIDHTCENTGCVNPAHLDAVSRAEHCRRTMQRLGKDDLHAAAAMLRSARLTYAQIAEALGFAGREGASDAVGAAIRKGLVDPSDVPPAPRLTAAERADMQDMRAMGVPVGVLADVFGIDGSQASRVSRGLSGRHPATSEADS